MLLFILPDSPFPVGGRWVTEYLLHQVVTRMGKITYVKASGSVCDYFKRVGVTVSETMKPFLWTSQEEISSFPSWLLPIKGEEHPSEKQKECQAGGGCSGSVPPPCMWWALASLASVDNPDLVSPWEGVRGVGDKPQGECRGNESESHHCICCVSLGNPQPFWASIS